MQISSIDKVKILFNSLIKFGLILWLLVNFDGYALLGQDHFDATDASIKCKLVKTVRSREDLNGVFVITNTSKHTVALYEELVEGFMTAGLGRNLSNLTLIVQKKNGAKFSDYSQGTMIDPSPNDDTVDILKRKLVASGDSLINYFHIDSRYAFERGVYRLKCIYRNNINDMNKIESEWIYFRVTKDIFVHHYYVNPPLTDSTKSP